MRACASFGNIFGERGASVPNGPPLLCIGFIETACKLRHIRVDAKFCCVVDKPWDLRYKFGQSHVTSRITNEGIV